MYIELKYKHPFEVV